MRGIRSRTIAFLFGLLALALFQGCRAEENPLLGSWKWDNDKTLSHMIVSDGASDEVKKSAQKARLFVEGVANKLRSNVVLSYRHNDCDQVMYSEDGQVLSKETFPYKIVEFSKNVVVIDQFDNGGVVKMFRENGNSMYVKVTVGNYTYKDYFVRVK